MTITIVAASPAAAAAYAELNAQPMVAWDNVLARGTIASGTLPTAAPRLNAVSENTVDFWQPTAADTLRATFAGAEAADVAFFAAHNLGGKTIKVQAYNGAIWIDVATYAVPNNQPFMIVFPNQSWTGWGIHVSAACIIGVAWIGPRVTIPGGVVPGYSPIWASRQVSKWGGGTRRGHWLGQRVDAITAQLSATFMPIPYSVADVTLRSFGTRYNDGRAFVWASAPGIFSRDVAYCWAEDSAVFAPTIMAGGDLCELGLSMTAYCEP